MEELTLCELENLINLVEHEIELRSAQEYKPGSAKSPYLLELESSLAKLKAREEILTSDEEG